jgi:hypothetical protein
MGVQKMKTLYLWGLLLFITAWVHAASGGDVINIITTGKTHDEIIKNLSAYDEKMGRQLLTDVYFSIQCIQRHVRNQEGLSEKQRDAYFVSLAGNRQLRDMILTAAAIAVAESSQLPKDKDPLLGLDPNSDEYKTTRYLIMQQSIGVALIETYTQCQSDGESSRTNGAAETRSRAEGVRQHEQQSGKQKGDGNC